MIITLRDVVRLLVEMLDLFVLGMTMLILAIVGAKQLPDEKLQYFVIGYYVAIHHDLVLWMWKKLGIDKKSDDA